MGKRIKDITLAEQTFFSPSLRLLVDKMDADPGSDWLQAKNIQLKYLGNTYFQGSTNNVNWHDDITTLDTYIRFTTDGGITWKDLSTKNVREDTNLYFTEARVLGISDVDDAIINSHTHVNKYLLDNLINSGDGNSFLSNNGTYKNLTGATGTFTSADAKTITVVDGIITSIV